MDLGRSTRVAEDDVDQLFGEIQKAPEQLRRQMFGISKYLDFGDGAGNWAKSLRLLTLAQTEYLRDVHGNLAGTRLGSQ